MKKITAFVEEIQGEDKLPKAILKFIVGAFILFLIAEIIRVLYL